MNGVRLPRRSFLCLVGAAAATGCLDDTQSGWRSFGNDRTNSAFAETSPPSGDTSLTADVGTVASSPAVVGKTAYVGTLGGEVVAVNAAGSEEAEALGELADGNVTATTETVWTRSVGGEIYSSPAVVDGRLYVGSRNGDFVCLLRTHQLLSHGVWRHRVFRGRRRTRARSRCIQRRD